MCLTNHTQFHLRKLYYDRNKLRMKHLQYNYLISSSLIFPLYFNRCTYMASVLTWHQLTLIRLKMLSDSLSCEWLKTTSYLLDLLLCSHFKINCRIFHLDNSIVTVLNFPLTKFKTHLLPKVHLPH